MKAPHVSPLHVTAASAILTPCAEGFPSAMPEGRFFAQQHVEEGIGMFCLQRNVKRPGHILMQRVSKSLFVLLALGLAVSSLPGQLYARHKKNRNAKVPIIALPADYTIDLQLALSGRRKLLGNSAPIIGTPINRTANEVFDTLVGSQPISSLGLPYQWRLTLVGNDIVNAASTAGGQVYADGGLARLIGEDKGLWAAVLSHEIMHTALRHQVRDYLERVYIAQQIKLYRLEIARGDKAASYALLGFSIAAPLALKKMEREQEHQADMMGMMLMARAGYHPDFVFALHHLLEAETGDQSKFAAFFSNHPRWATRDRRSEKAYVDALRVYKSLWHDPIASPGGLPPVVAFLGKPVVSKDKQDRSADVSLPLSCRNAQRPVAIFLNFTSRGAPVPSADLSLSDSHGNLMVREEVTCSDKDGTVPVNVKIPSTALALGKDRKLKAQVTILDSSGDLIGRSKVLKVQVPK